MKLVNKSFGYTGFIFFVTKPQPICKLVCEGSHADYKEGGKSINGTDKYSSITIFALILELMFQILSVFSVKLTSALEIYRQKHRRTGGG